MLLLIAVLLPNFIPASASAQAAPLSEKDIPNDLPSDLKSLLEQTFSSDPHSRAVAAQKIGEMGERGMAAVPFLLRLLNDRDPEQIDANGYEVYYANRALEKMGKPAIEAWIAAAKKDSNLIIGLGQLSDPLALDALLDFLKSWNSETSRTALLALSNCKDDRATPLILSLLNRGSLEMRRFAAECFRSIRDPKAVQPLLNNLDKLAIVWNSDEENSRRVAIVEALGFQHDPRAIQPLLTILKNEKENVRLRHEAAKSLGQISESVAIPDLIEILEDRKASSFVRAGAALGIGAYRPALTIADNGNRESVRDDARILYLFTDLMNNDDESLDLRIATAQAMGQFGNPKAIKALTKTVHSHGADPLGFWAATSIIKLSKGPITDADVIKAIEDYQTNDPESGFDLREQKIALKRIEK